MTAEQEARQTAQISEIRRKLGDSYGTLRPRTFYYNGPDTGSQAAYEFVRRLGGSMTDRRGSFFEIDIDINRRQSGRDFCYGVVIARILDRDPPSGASWEVIAQGSEDTGWPGRCNQPPERLIKNVLYGMR